MTLFLVGLCIGLIAGFAASLLLDLGLDWLDARRSEAAMARYGERAESAARRTP